MKKSGIQIKNPRIQLKNPKIWILGCNTYLQGNRQESTQESAKNPKLKNRRETKNLQRLAGERISQESKNPKLTQNFSQILESTKPILTCLHSFFPRIQLHPPPLHGGYEIPSMDGMEVSFLHLTNLNFYQQQKQKI